MTDRRTVQEGTPAKGHTTAGSGEVYKRHDGKWAWRIKAGDGQVVATGGGQGSETKTDTRSTLEKVSSSPVNELD